MKQLFLLAGLFCSCRIFAQDYTRIPFGFRSVNNGIGTEITCYGAATVRVLKYPVGDSVRRQSLSVIRNLEAPSRISGQMGLISCSKPPISSPTSTLPIT